MTGTPLEYLIIAFIIGGIAYVTFRGGQANPETTGRLHKRLSGIEGDVKSLSQRVGDIEKRSATSAEVKRLERLLEQAQEHREEQTAKIAELQSQLAAHSQQTSHTARQVDRLYDFIVERGMSK